jgi:hypothetical protein
MTSTAIRINEKNAGRKVRAFLTTNCQAPAVTVITWRPL